MIYDCFFFCILVVKESEEEQEEEEEKHAGCDKEEASDDDDVEVLQDLRKECDVDSLVLSQRFEIDQEIARQLQEDELNQNYALYDSLESGEDDDDDEEYIPPELLKETKTKDHKECHQIHHKRNHNHNHNKTPTTTKAFISSQDEVKEDDDFISNEEWDKNEYPKIKKKDLDMGCCNLCGVDGMKWLRPTFECKDCKARYHLDCDPLIDHFHAEDYSKVEFKDINEFHYDCMDYAQRNYICCRCVAAKGEMIDLEVPKRKFDGRIVTKVGCEIDEDDTIKLKEEWHAFDSEEEGIDTKIY